MSPKLSSTAIGLVGLASIQAPVNQFCGTTAWIEDALYLVATVINLLLVAAVAARLIYQPKVGAMLLGFLMLATITVLRGGIALRSLVALLHGVFLPAGPP
jgi:hypothetical protein